MAVDEPKKPEADKVEKTDQADKTDKSDKTEAKPVASLAERFKVRKRAEGDVPAAPRNIRGTIIKVAAVVVALLAVVVLVFGVLVYVYRSESPVTKSVSEYVPYPAERVNGRFVSYYDYLFEVDANKRAYENNAKLNNQPAVDFKSEEGKKLVVQIKQHALEKLQSDALVAQLASEKKVKVTDKEIDELIKQLYERYGGKDTLMKTLNQIYGWDLSDLKKVVYKQLLAKNLEEKVTSDPAVDAQAKAKAQDVLKKVKDGGANTP